MTHDSWKKSTLCDASINVLNLQLFVVKLGNYHTSAAAVATNDTSTEEAEQRTIRSILDQDKTAAAIVCQLKVRYHERTSHMPLMKDILGFVATLGKVNDDNLSRSNFLLAINVPELWTYFFRVSSLAYPNLLGKKGYVVVVVVWYESFSALIDAKLIGMICVFS